VRASDANGLADPTPASFSWQIDTVVPETTLTRHPPDPNRYPFARFEFVSSEGASSFRCKLDGGRTVTCSSPQSYYGLAEGRHSFTVFAVDAAGNADPTPEVFGWRVDLTAPQPTLTSHPAAISRFARATFGFSSSERGSFECKLDA